MLIKRNIFNELCSQMGEPEISILLGTRQVGKSTLLLELQKKAQASGYSCAFFDLEQSRDLQKLTGSEEEVLRTIKGEEVDFILLKNRVPIPIEVKSSLPSLQIPKGLQCFLRCYPKAPKAVVYNVEIKATVPFENRLVYFEKWSGAEHLPDVNGIF